MKSGPIKFVENPILPPNIIFCIYWSFHRFGHAVYTIYLNSSKNLTQNKKRKIETAFSGLRNNNLSRKICDTENVSNGKNIYKFIRALLL